MCLGIGRRKMFFFHQLYIFLAFGHLKCTSYLSIYGFEEALESQLEASAWISIWIVPFASSMCPILGVSTRGRRQKGWEKSIKQMPSSRGIDFVWELLAAIKEPHFWHSSRLFTTLFFTDLTVSSLGMVHVTIPNAIQSGRNVIMTCDYELEDDDLYSVKWYKGKREFFRYTPKEIPSIKIFKLPGIRVDVSWLLIPLTRRDIFPTIFLWCGKRKMMQGRVNFSLVVSKNNLI